MAARDLIGLTIIALNNNRDSICVSRILGKFDGVAKGPPYSITAISQDLDLPDGGLRS